MAAKTTLYPPLSAKYIWRGGKRLTALPDLALARQEDPDTVVNIRRSQGPR